MQFPFLYATLCLVYSVVVQACPLINDPVCGVDGKEYANSCQAESLGVEIAHDGRCIKEYNPKTGKATGCRFTKKYVCGVDGKTYQNDCVAHAHGVGVAYGGNCILQKLSGRGVGGSRCHCPRNRDPVCGHDGMTYSNQCVAQCAGAKVLYKGVCKERLQNKGPSRNPDYTANQGNGGGGNANYNYQDYSNDYNNKQGNGGGANANYYDYNAGKPNQQGNGGGDYSMYYDGSPDYNGNIGNQGQSQMGEGSISGRVIGGALCACTREHSPVCGEDGQTYGNGCLAECAGVSVSEGGAQGPCNSRQRGRGDKIEPQEPFCPCPKIRREVCGSDMETYTNACIAECQGVKYVNGRC